MGALVRCIHVHRQLPAVVALLCSTQLSVQYHAQLLPPGPRLRDLAAARNPPLLIGTDLIDSFPFPATGNPADCVGGNDPQLEKAIEVILEMLEADPPVETEMPPYPIRVRR